MPLPFELFKLDKRLCPELVLRDEDQPQDERDWKRMVREHQEKHYTIYMSQFEPEDVAQPKEHVAIHVAQQVNGATKSRAEYFRKYRKMKRCRHCGELNP